MIEAHVHADTSVTLHEVSIPDKLEPHQLLIQVAVASCNPKDWKMPAGLLKTIADCPNSGDDVAGVVAAVGSSVRLFRVGDRVAALHQLGAPHGAFAQYAVVESHAAFHLGDQTSFEEAAGLPMGLLMAAIGLFGLLRVTSPWEPLPSSIERPLVIYGATGSVGSYAVKLASIANIHPLICVCGHGSDAVENLIDRSRGDTILDYRQGDDTVLSGLKEALHGRKLEYAFDAVSEKGSYNIISKALADNGHLSLVLPHHAHEVPARFERSVTMAGSLWKPLETLDQSGEHDVKLGFVEGGQEFGTVISSLITHWLSTGKLKPNEFKIVPGGLGGLEKALKDLRSGEAHGVKLVIQIAETPGLGQ